MMMYYIFIIIAFCSMTSSPTPASITYKPGDCKISLIGQTLLEKMQRMTKLKRKYLPSNNESELVVDYGNSSICSSFLDGFGINALEAEKKPTSVKWISEPNKFYTLLLMDTFPSPDGEMELRNWLVGNIVGNNVDAGETIVAYNTKFGELYETMNLENWGHPHVFLLFEQPGKLTFNETKLDEKATNERYFEFDKFVDKYKLGRPHSAIMD